MRTPSAPTPIELDALTLVSGGARRAQADERILDKIQSLAGAVADVGMQQPPQANPGAALMPIVAMKMMKRPA